MSLHPLRNLNSEADRSPVPVADFAGYLLKRSRVTRVLQKRFIVIRGSRVYSYRKVDLSLGLPSPSSASLEWGIEGCAIEAQLEFSILGGSSLGGEIVTFQGDFAIPFFKRATLGIFTHTKNHKNQLRSLLEPYCRYTFESINLNPALNSASVYVELSGSLYHLSESTNIVPEWEASRDPIKFVIYSQLVNYTGYIGRERIPRSGSKRLNVVLISNKSSSSVEMSLSVSSDLSLSEYFCPLVLAPLRKKFQWDFFKILVKRAIRIFEIYAQFRTQVIDILEWRWRGYSFIWFLYLSGILLIKQGAFAAGILALHLAINYRTFYLRVQSKQISFSEPQEITSKQVPGVSGSTTATVIYENQRRLLGSSVFHGSNLLVIDRPKFSDDSGSVSLPHPDPQLYRVFISKETDENGWQYSFRWGGGWGGGWREECGTMDFVRRRKWVGLGTVLPEIVSETRSVAQQAATKIKALITPRAQDSGSESDDHVPAKPVGGISGMVAEFRGVANKAQRELEEVCQNAEMLLSFFSGRDAIIGEWIMVGCFISSLCLLIFPLSWVVWIYLASLFLSGYRKGQWKRILREKILNHIKSVRGSAGEDLPKFAQLLGKRMGVEISVKMAGDSESDEILVEIILKKIIPEPAKWLRRDWFDNLICHSPVFNEETLISKNIESEEIVASNEEDASPQHFLE